MSNKKALKNVSDLSYLILRERKLSIFNKVIGQNLNYLSNETPDGKASSVNIGRVYILR